MSGGQVPLGFRLRESYRIIEEHTAPARRRWRVTITDYSYTFLLRASGLELLAFHWHPHVVAKEFPHVHLESGLGLQCDLIGIHVPTGRISPEDVVRFAIEELQIQPRLPNWAAVLEQTRAQTAEPPGR